MDTKQLMDVVNAYFAGLNDYEKYAWIAVLAGFVLVIIGVILLFL